jgi:outer membrane protein TolC
MKRSQRRQRLPRSLAAAAAAAVVLWASVAAAQGAPDAQTVPPLPLVHPDGAAAPPMVITLKDALQRAGQNDPQYQASASDAANAHQDAVQARAALLPELSNTTQYLGNQSNGVNPNGRFVSLDGVNMYREWAVLHQDISPDTVTHASLHSARATEAAAKARLEVAQRGLAVTVTRSYYALVVAQRKYAAAQDAAQQAARFLQMTQQQERLGQVARADVIKADIQSRQEEQSYREAMLGMDNAQLALSVLVFPDLNQNFTVVDDMSAAPALPPFPDVRTMAGRENPDLRAANEALLAATADVHTARYAFYPKLVLDVVYGIEANEFALHSRIASLPELGVLPNLGYFVTAALNVPVWDWGTRRAKLAQAGTHEHQAAITLSFTQRQIASNLYMKYNEALAARAAVDSLQQVADLATESLRLTTLRYQAGESTALEVVDAQNTLVQARGAADDALARYRVALADLQTLTGAF